MGPFPLLWVTERTLCREPFLDRVPANAEAGKWGANGPRFQWLYDGVNWKLMFN